VRGGREGTKGAGEGVTNGCEASIPKRLHKHGFEGISLNRYCSLGRSSLINSAQILYSWWGNDTILADSQKPSFTRSCAISRTSPSRFPITKTPIAFPKVRMAKDPSDWLKSPSLFVIPIFNNDRAGTNLRHLRAKLEARTGILSCISLSYSLTHHFLFGPDGGDNFQSTRPAQRLAEILLLIGTWCDFLMFWESLRKGGRFILCSGNGWRK
jgi:hypothetical protein